MTVNVESVDRRTITAKFPVSPGELANALGGLGDGYELTDASTVEGGHQRDPITEGIRLVFTRMGAHGR